MSDSAVRGRGTGAGVFTRAAVAIQKTLKALELSGSVPVLNLSDEQLGKVEASLWVGSPERVWYMKRRAKVMVFACLGGALLLLAGYLGQPPRTTGEMWWSAIVLAFAFFTLCYCTFPYWAARLAFSERRRKSAAYRAEKALADLGAESPVPLPKLLVYNRRQLDAYQEESRRQQRNSNRHAQPASFTGLLVLVAGISISLRQAPGSEQYVVAGLAGLGTLLSGFMGATFLLSARRADEQLNLYYQEPHMMGRIIVAERVAVVTC